MKINLFSTILFSALLTLNGFAQVSINKDGSTADSAAILQVKGDNNGSKWTCYDNQSVFNAQFVCRDNLIDYRDSSSYSTVQIGNQCWMAKNLNLGTMISSSYSQTNNDTFEKFCYNNQEDSCDVYGGLYQWDEMMNYVSTSGAQGICPTGWHISSDAEWKTMEMALGMSQQSADSSDWRGTNEGGMLKDTGTIYWTPPIPALQTPQALQLWEQVS